MLQAYHTKHISILFGSMCVLMFNLYFIMMFFCVGLGWRVSECLWFFAVSRCKRAEAGVCVQVAFHICFRVNLSLPWWTHSPTSSILIATITRRAKFNSKFCVNISHSWYWDLNVIKTFTEMYWKSSRAHTNYQHQSHPHHTDTAPCHPNRPYHTPDNTQPIKPRYLATRIFSNDNIRIILQAVLHGVFIRVKLIARGWCICNRI